MIPIDKRLDYNECLIFALKVKSCMNDDEWKLFKDSIMYMNKELHKNSPLLYKELNNNNIRYKNYCNKELEKDDEIVISWLTMEYDLLEKIKEYIYTTYIEKTIRQGNNIQKYKCKELKSYSDLIRRRKLPYKDNLHKIEIQNILKKSCTYDYIYNNFRTYKEIYEKFSDKAVNSWIIKKTDMNICPYCDLAYTYNRGKKVTAQLDHFFSKSEYPMFVLCYYNLIPSCPACNHIKTDNNEEMTSPYAKNAFKDMKIKWKLASNKKVKEENVEGLISDIEICVDSDKTKDKKNIEVMQLNEAYNKHKDYASEIIKKIQTYLNEDSKRLIQTIAFKNKISSDEIEHFYLGTYIDKDKKIDRILEKMSRDFVQQYKEEEEK